MQAGRNRLRILGGFLERYGRGTYSFADCDPVSFGTPHMDTPRYRLPKTIENDPRAAHLLQRLVANGTPLWERAALPAALLDLGDAVETALRSAYQSGALVRGLEAAERRLDEEERGLSRVRTDQDRESGVRISRLIVVTSDGSERFYRNVESLLRRHGERVCALRLQTDEHSLGGLLYGPGRVTRLVLVEHKNVVASLLLAAAEQWATPHVPAEHDPEQD